MPVEASTPELGKARRAATHLAGEEDLAASEASVEHKALEAFKT
jgi:hypothetical protein